MTNSSLAEHYPYKDLYLSQRDETAIYKSLAEDREKEKGLIRTEVEKLKRKSVI